MIHSNLFSALEMARIVGGKLVGNDEKIEYFSLDSKEKSKEPFCFVAIKGKQFDGNDFVEEAIRNGAKIILTNREIEAPVSIIIVKNVKTALLKLGQANKKETKIIGVTGSVGKTTVKEMLKTVLEEKYHVSASLNNENNEIGVAKTLLSIRGEDYCVCEMGARHLKDVEKVAKYAEPDISVITNVYSSHIGLFKTKENIFKAKSEILTYTKSCAVLPNDEYFAHIFDNLEKIIVGKDIIIEKYWYKKDKILIKLEQMKKKIAVYSYGLFQMDNVMSVVAVCKKIGLNEEEILKGIQKFRNSLREEIISYRKSDIIKDCYNASFEGMKSAIQSAVEYAKKRKKPLTLMLGDMLELGEYAKEYHYRIGEYAKDLEVSNLIAIGKNAKDYVDGFCGGCVVKNLEEARKEIRQIKKNVILVKGSRKMKLETMIENL